MVWYNKFLEKYFWDIAEQSYSFSQDINPIVFTDSILIAIKVRDDLNKTLTD